VTGQEVNWLGPPSEADQAKMSGNREGVGELVRFEFRFPCTHRNDSDGTLDTVPSEGTIHPDSR
jgi:hypothetical protein